MKKIKEKTKKEFDTVKFFRNVKKKISKETGKMSFEQYKEYLKLNRLTPIK